MVSDVIGTQYIYKDFLITNDLNLIKVKIRGNDNYIDNKKWDKYRP